MEIVGLEPRRSDLARGILIARSTSPLDAATQKALWDALSSAGVTEQADEDTADEPLRQWHAAPWLPPEERELPAHRSALEAAAARFGLDTVWFVKVETGIDGLAWLELAAAAGGEEAGGEAPSEAEEGDGGEEGEGSEVLYAAPDAPGADEPEEEVPEAGEGDVDELEAEAELEIPVESHWRNGPPPVENSVGFPLEHYPEILEDYDGDSFGIAIKLAAPGLPGEESVVNAFFALWLSVYQDERVDEFEPFQRADAVHDRRHRSALMWVEQFEVPATAGDQVHFLMWIVARLHEILPVAWARFESVDAAVKASAAGNDSGSPPFVLAGNPFAERFRRHGEDAALAWSVAQSSWDKSELAAMLVELALEHDPDEPATAAVAERLLRRALSFEPASDAAGYLAIVLIRQHRAAEAIALARTAKSHDVRLLVIGELAEHAPAELPAALELLAGTSVREAGAEELAELAASVARHAPARLPDLLARLPDDVALVPHLYNASFAVDRPQALVILRRVLSLPEPPRDSGEARTALVMAWNNACIHAHALGEYKLAIELADGGQPYAGENPYIYHSAACAYAAVGEIDRALDQVARAIEHDYEHTEKMETDPDLAPLQTDARFAGLFNEWRTKRADLN